MRDEVNEPLGLSPAAELGPVEAIARKMWPLAAPAVVALAMAVFPFIRDAQPRMEGIAARTGAPPAPAPAESPPASPRSAQADHTASPLVAAAVQTAAPSGVKVTRPGESGSLPTPLIIDVQQALATMKAMAPPAVHR